MTDKEIEKALKICGKSGDCLNCPYDVDNCMQKELDALAYINRLKAENERLRISDQSKENCTIEQHAEVHRLRDELKQVRKDTAKETWKILLDELFLVLNSNVLLTPDIVMETFNDVAKAQGIEVDE